MTHRILSTRKMQITAAAALAGALFVGVAAPGEHLAGATHQGRSIAIIDSGTHDMELTASSTRPIFYQTHWDLDRGQEGYVEFIRNLRLQLTLATGATRREYDMGKGKQVAVDTLKNTATDRFSDVEVTTGGHSIHLIVRLSDLYVVGFHTRVDRPGDFQGFQHVYIPLAADAPQVPNGLVTGNAGTSYTTNTDWQGRENYNDIARLGNTRLTDTTVGHTTLVQAVMDMRNPHRRNQQVWMRGLLRMIMGLSEAARLRPVGTSIAVAFDHGGHRITPTDVALIRNWQGLSNVYHHYGDTGASSSNTQSSVDIVGYGRIDTLREVLKLIQIALGFGEDPNPKDEL